MCIVYAFSCHEATRNCSVMATRPDHVYTREFHHKLTTESIHSRNTAHMRVAQNCDTVNLDRRPGNTLKAESERTENLQSQVSSCGNRRNDGRAQTQPLLPKRSRSSKSATLTRLDRTLTLDHLSNNRQQKSSEPCNTGVYLSCSARVASALRHTEKERNVYFYGGRLRRLHFGHDGNGFSFDPGSGIVQSNTSEIYRLDDYRELASAEKVRDESMSYSYRTSELPSGQSDATSETCSISLVPGVFGRDRNPPTRIFVKYRQLSTDERVLEWLYKYCTHPSQTVPLL